MKSYYMKRTAFAVFLAVYPYASWALGTALQGEILPAFDWQLFTDIKANPSAYAIQVSAVDGEELTEPTFFSQAGVFFKRSQSPLSHRLTSSMANAFRSGNTDDFWKYRRRFESLMFDDHRSVQYRLVRLNKATIFPGRLSKAQEVLDYMKYERRD